MPWWYQGKRIDKTEEYEAIVDLIEEGKLHEPLPEFHFHTPEHTQRLKRSLLERFENK
jgi:hypothetical protein